jgi:chromosomal replication initiator protein
MSYIEDLKEIWELVKVTLNDKYPESFVNLWFGELTVHDFDNDRNLITMATESELKYNILNKKYLGDLKDGFAEQLGFESNIKVIFTGDGKAAERIRRQVAELMKQEQERGRYAQNPPNNDFDDEDDEDNIHFGERVYSDDEELQIKPISDEYITSPMGVLPMNYNFEYTFDNFIVGNSNKFAHAACTAVAERPATNYNPLFIYGPSGLGKTHLMSAVVNEIKKKKPNIRVVYVKGDEFTNQMIESLSKHEMHKFHNKYRNCDILLIDDVQFIAGKESTQEEFFHTFNTLYEERKQIILSSDRPPKDIQTLEERLKTRFEWGLIADIQPPDLELRIAIIKKKAEQINIELPPEVLTFLAENLRSNIRQLEGAIKRLSALSFFYGKTITMELAKNSISEFLGGAEPLNITIDKIFAAIYRKYNISKAELVGTKRNKDIAAARHMTIYLMRSITDMSLQSIGDIFNGRDHTTIKSSYDLIQRKIATDPTTKVTIDELTKEIQA